MKNRIKEKAAEMSAVGIVGILLLAGTTAAAAGIAVASITGTVTVQDGVTYEATETFDGEINSGDEVSYGLTLSNDANTKTNYMVERVVISSEDQDLSHRNLDRVEFDAWTTEDSSVNHQEEGDFVLHIERDENGDISSVDTGDYLTASTNDNGDVVTCIGDENMNFEPDEEWEKHYTFDTSNQFVESGNEFTVSAELHTLYDRETGEFNDAVSDCEQFDAEEQEFVAPSTLY